VRVPDAGVVPELARAVIGHGGRLRHFAAVSTSLEEMFLAVMGDDGRPG
jgi:hypothetical protein